MKTYKIAAIPGDGIGTEVISAGVEVLQALAKRAGSFQFKVDHFDWGGEYYKKHGRMMPVDGREQIKDHDAILFGSAGHPDIPDHITLWGLRLNICQPFDQYANVRPTRVLPGITSPLRHVESKELDWVIVRENSEGEYAGVGGRAHQGSPLEAATDVSMFTRIGVERVMRFAFKLARSRPRKLLTVVTKSNAQGYSMVLWDRVFEDVAAQYPHIETETLLVDAAATRPGISTRRHDGVEGAERPGAAVEDLAGHQRDGHLEVERQRPDHLPARPKERMAGIRLDAVRSDQRRAPVARRGGLRFPLMGSASSFPAQAPARRMKHRVSLSP